MSCDVQRVIDIAKGEIGYLEKETWSDLDDKTANAGDENFVKYSRDLAKISYFNSSKKGVAWCAIFVAWDYVQAYGPKAAKKLLCQPTRGNCGAGCNSFMNYFKSKKQFYSEPNVGDIIFFWSSEKPTEAGHTGIVTKVTSKYVYTVEGNTSSDNGVVENGGSVNDKKYRIDYERIAGYGRPNYANVNPDAGYEDSTTFADDVEQNNKEEANMVTGQAWVVAKNGTTVNYRKAPSKIAAKVSGCKTIKTGEEVYIKTSDDVWAAVEYKGYQGYMMLEFLTTENPNKESETVSDRSVDQIVADITALVKELAVRAK